MEMHQVRYFLAVARTLNFTRAAEECNVAQPSLTRAVRQLEGELGGDLFRRERPHAQLTELGQRTLPLLRQCYESALGARSLASSIKSGEVSSLRMALSTTIDLSLVMPHILELRKHFGRLELKLLRGNAAQIADFMKSGEAELAVASTLGEAWDRIDKWPLFAETFTLVANGGHRLATLTPSTSRICATSRSSCERIASILKSSPTCCEMRRWTSIALMKCHQSTILQSSCSKGWALRSHRAVWDWPALLSAPRSSILIFDAPCSSMASPAASARRSAT